MTIVFCNQVAKDRFNEGITAKKTFPPINSYWTTSNLEVEQKLIEHLDLEQLSNNSFGEIELSKLYKKVGQLLLILGGKHYSISVEVLNLWAFLEESIFKNETVYAKQIDR